MGVQVLEPLVQAHEGRRRRRSRWVISGSETVLPHIG
jgi:hypothetical protein